MSENIKPLSLAEGKAYLDGEEVMDLSKMTIRFNPKVASYKVAVKKYIKDGLTPEFTIQGVRSDPDSDYYASVGSESVTVTGAVITSEIPLMDIDTDGEVVKESITFGGRAVV